MKKKQKGIVVKVLLAILAVFLIFVILAVRKIYPLMYPTPMQSGEGEKTVVCIGDSITYGQGVLDSRETDSYPALLAGLLGEEYRVINYGACNRTMVSDGNAPYAETGFVEQSLEENPDIVIIMMGTNDSKPQNWDAAQFEKDYTGMVEQFVNAESKPDIYLMFPPNSYREEKEGDETAIDSTIISGELQEIIKRIAEEYNAGVIDLNTPTDGKEELFADGVHPTAEGNELIARIIYQAIAEKE